MGENALLSLGRFFSKDLSSHKIGSPCFKAAHSALQNFTFD